MDIAIDSLRVGSLAELFDLATGQFLATLTDKVVYTW